MLSGREDDQPGVVVVPPNPERFERPDLGDDETAADADPQLLSLEIARFIECAWKSPNDLKLSDGGAWRGSCVVERRRDIRATEK